MSQDRLERALTDTSPLAEAPVPLPTREEDRVADERRDRPRALPGALGSGQGNVNQWTDGNSRTRARTGAREAAASAERRSSGRNPDYLYHRLLAASDIVSLAAAAGLASLATVALGRDEEFGMLGVMVLAALPFWLLIAYWADLYHDIDQRIDHDYVDEIGKIMIAATVWSWLFVLVRSLIADGTGQLFSALLWLLMIPVLLFGRSLLRRYARRQPWSRQPVAIIGESPAVEAFLRRVDRHPEWGFDVRLEVPLGRDGAVTERFVGGPGESGSLLRPTGRPNPGWLWSNELGEGGNRDLVAELDRLGIGRVLLAVGSLDLSERTKLIHEFIEAGIAVHQISSRPDALDFMSTRGHLEGMPGMPVVSVGPSTPRPGSLAIKRSFDIFASAIGLLVLSPVMLWAAIRIKRDSKGPVFYRQARCGLGGESFEMIKFRTMFDGAHGMRSELRSEDRDNGSEDVLFKLDADPRITEVGVGLRQSSIDELPQLWNVLKGDMSMVGPRPLVFEEAEKATEPFDARTRMKPGIAGLWQSLGRSAIPFEDMIRLDYAYVVGWSISLDMKLLLLTIAAVARRDGAL